MIPNGQIFHIFKTVGTTTTNNNNIYSPVCFYNSHIKLAMIRLIAMEPGKGAPRGQCPVHHSDG